MFNSIDSDSTSDFVAAGEIGTSQWENCISLDYILYVLRGPQNPRNPRK